MRRLTHHHWGLGTLSAHGHFVGFLAHLRRNGRHFTIDLARLGRNGRHFTIHLAGLGRHGRQVDTALVNAVGKASGKAVTLLSVRARKSRGTDDGIERRCAGFSKGVESNYFAGFGNGHGGDTKAELFEVAFCRTILERGMNANIDDESERGRSEKSLDEHGRHTSARRRAWIAEMEAPMKVALTRELENFMLELVMRM